MASTFATSRPSEKLGTHSIRRFMFLWEFAQDRKLERALALRSMRPFRSESHQDDT
jgi:hypothetical protein